MAGGQTLVSPTDPGRSLGGSWHAYRGSYGLPGRWGRSAAFVLIVSLIGLLLVSIIRLLIVAGYNPATALAILSSGGYVDTLLGAIIPLVPLFAPYLALVLLFFNRVILAILTILATAFMTPVATTRAAALHLARADWQSVTHRGLLAIIVMAVLGLVFVFLLTLVFLGPGFVAGVRTVATVACIALIPFVATIYPFPLSNQFYTGVLKQPWLPAQVITLVSGPKVTGYVLSDNGTWVVVLDDPTRTVHYYRSAQVAARQICQIRPAPPRPPLIPLYPGHLTSPTSTPACVTVASARLASAGGRAR
jgi:hypothetical protein